MNVPTQQRLTRTQRSAALLAVVGGLACAATAHWFPTPFAEAYLCAALVVLGLGLGSMALLMLHHLVGGAWGIATRRLLEAACWPLMLGPLWVVPLAFTVRPLYPWMDPQVVRGDRVLEQKVPYLNVEFFYGRTLGYLLVWAVMAGLLCRWSRVADRADHGKYARRLAGLSGIGMAVYVLTATFSAIDWMMTLEPHWFSAIYGVIVIAGQCAGALAVSVVSLSWLRFDDQLRQVTAPGVWQDLGNLLLASITLWVYVTFSQYLIIWSGNLAEEVPWYLRRSSNGWQWLTLLVVGFHFLIPFFALLSARVKSDPRRLAFIAWLVVISHCLDIYWLVMPARRQSLYVHWADLLTLAALTSLWVFFSVWRLKSASLVSSASQHTGQLNENLIDERAAAHTSN